MRHARNDHVKWGIYNNMFKHTINIFISLSFHFTFFVIFTSSSKNMKKHHPHYVVCTLSKSFHSPCTISLSNKTSYFLKTFFWGRNKNFILYFLLWLRCNLEYHHNNFLFMRGKAIKDCFSFSFPHFLIGWCNLTFSIHKWDADRGDYGYLNADIFFQILAYIFSLLFLS